MKITPVKGCAEYAPKEAALRDAALQKILSVYEKNGFSRVYTPALEDVANLINSEGGENLNMIYKILKRGAKLSAAIESGNFDALCDLGLRYDLTLPLARFYANNREALPKPFKCVQTGSVYRAEQPQRGRLREFKQCDIDIIGDGDLECETEIIAVTLKALNEIGFSDCFCHINDRNLCAGALERFGCDTANFNKICAILDKSEKIGAAAVLSELEKTGVSEGSLQKIEDAIKNKNNLEYFAEIPECAARARDIAGVARAVGEITDARNKMVFDFALARGQAYYTGPVFEIRLEGYAGSVAGGGRYDNMIGSFTGERVPAVGFSIGFERICDILKNSGRLAREDKKIAVLYEKNAVLSDFCRAYGKAEALRREFGANVCLYKKPSDGKKLKKLLKRVESEGYDGFFIAGEHTAPKFFNRNDEHA